MPSLDEVAAALRKLARKRVLIGIPAEQAVRSDSSFSNVSRGYVFEFGSPAINMPARPHIVPGVEEALPEITKRLEAAARAVLKGEDPDMYLGQAGQAGENAVKAKIDSHIPPDIQPRSLLNRVTGRRARERRARREGRSILQQAEAEAASATPLVDTGAYRQSIKWVIRET